MGIVNVTPDSFSDGGQFFEHGMAVDHALRLAADGADILDVGGESTRPHSLPVAPEEELRRVVEVVRGIVRQTNVPVSIDTTKAAVARAALDAGAVIVNDISGLTFDPEMIEVCRSGNAGVVCMHIQGTPLTMQDNPQYADVAREVCECLAERLRSLIAAGIDVERIVLDPGVGFGKTAAHNLALLSNIARLKALGRPVLVGHSRKGFLKKIVGRDVDERSAGTLAVSLALAAQGVDLLRVHDVRATRDALAAWHAVQTAGDG
ncbi:MAG: dihydropteroate synthase [Planctomycetes bacterium]|nr:dihydropteroate synthase [Planctomycetota bacterium]